MKSFINRFTLKLIAMITMLIDHIGVIFLKNGDSLYVIFRTIGRISFPLFAFFIVEGMVHTRNQKRYLLQLFICAFTIDIVTFMFGFYNNLGGNSVTTLAFSALTIYFLQKKCWYKLLAIIPSSILFLIAFKIIPFYADYNIYGLFIIVGFYCCYLLSKLVVKITAINQELDEDSLLNSTYFRNLKNVSCVIYFITLTLVLYFIPLFAINNELIINMDFQAFAILAMPFILLYNGKKGYDSKYFKWGSYVFYPLHLLILYSISLLI